MTAPDAINSRFSLVTSNGRPPLAHLIIIDHHLVLIPIDKALVCDGGVRQKITRSG
jgi:hypothetical protein